MKGLDALTGRLHGNSQATGYADEEHPVTPPKQSHQRTNTTSSIFSQPSVKSKVQRSETVRTNATSSTSQHPPRPYLTRVPTVQTKYMEMLLHLDQIPRLHNILAAVFGWILLSGFLVFPGTFTSIRESDRFKDADNADEATEIASQIVNTINNVPLLYVSAFLSGVGALGCIGLWIRWRKNYVWLVNRIFLPTVLSALAGLLTTVVNVYTARDGVWSVTAKIAAIVTGSCAGVSAVFFGLYNFWALSKVRKQHDDEFPEEYRRKEKQKKRESLVEKVKRKAHEPAIQPGSIV